MAKPVRVVIDASLMPENPTGIFVYAMELARALAQRDDCELTVATPEPAPPGAQRLAPPTRVTDGRKRGVATRLQLWSEFQVPRWMRANGIEVYHGVHFSVPVTSRVSRVSTIHDLAPLRAPRLFQGGINWLYWRLLVFSGSRATRIVVPSKAVADDVMDLIGVPASRVCVTPLAPRQEITTAPVEAVDDLRARLEIGERPYLTCVGIWNRNKRVVDVIRALALLRAKGIDLDLVLCGQAMPGLRPHYAREIERLGLADRVHFAGHVPDAAMAALYTGAFALVFPSEMEGFGLPPLEAMSCGTPVIVSDIPVLREATGGAAMTVAPRSPAEIAGRVAELWQSPSCHEEWALRGKDHAATFSWQRTAAQTMEVYREIV